MSRPVYYLATPYTAYEKGINEAFIEAAKAAAVLTKRGLIVYSPIAHCHPIASHGGINHLDHDLWMTHCVTMLDECYGLIVVQMPGWRESAGVQLEIKRAAQDNKPISYFSWPMMLDTDDAQ